MYLLQNKLRNKFRSVQLCNGNNLSTQTCTEKNVGEINRYSLCSTHMFSFGVVPIPLGHHNNPNPCGTLNLPNNGYTQAVTVLYYNEGSKRVFMLSYTIPVDVKQYRTLKCTCPRCRSMGMVGVYIFNLPMLWSLILYVF